MNSSQEQLLSLLILAIHDNDRHINSKLFSSIDGLEIYKLAIQQNVCAFLYPTLSKYSNVIKIEEQILQRWKENTIWGATRQLIMIKGIKIILSLFESNGIEVISLKGLVLKQLYPQPELREMCDLDLFIKEKDMDKSVQLLKTIGYQPKYDYTNRKISEYMHIEMIKPGSVSVELHRTLWPLNNMKKRDNQAWFNHIWQNKRLVEVEGIQFWSLPLEDELINLVIHLAKHLMNYGAPLRQLCDIVLFLETYWHILDIEYFYSTIKSMNLFLFFQHLLTTCHLFLKLTIPSNYNFLEKEKSETLMNEIFNIEMINTTTDENECWVKLKGLYPFARTKQYFIPIAFVIEVARQSLRKKKNIFESISFSKRSFKIFGTKARFLRSIGLLKR
jgi:hypothetical protein